MLKTTLLIVAAAVAALLIYAATRPDSFRLERSTTIAAPPDKVFALVNELRQFNVWNPFAKQDPKIEISYDATTAGVSGAYSWRGDKSGAGRMQIVESVPPRMVTMKLDFTKPFEAHNMVNFMIQPQGEGSKVTWAMHGPMPYLNKLMTIFFSMEKMVGSEFEAGLASLKALAERP
jgi:uncharacterized protein YndB with AHSA1/START domain